MSMYQSASFSDPGVTNEYTQVPKGIDFSQQRVNHSTIPAPEIVQDRPTSVILNATGKYGFIYQTSSSIGGTIAQTGLLYISGGAAIDAGPIELPIQPVAWQRGSGEGAVGDVVFIYKGVK